MLLEKEIHRRRLQTRRCGTDWFTSPGSPVLGYLSFLLCPASSVLGRLSRVTYPGTPVLGHLSWVTCPASPVLSRRAWQCYQFVMDTLRLCRVTAECYCRHAQHSLASSLLESNVFRIYVVFFVFERTLRVSIFLTQQVPCHMLSSLGIALQRNKSTV